MNDPTTTASILDSSILNDIKKYIGPSISYTVFDMDILMNINAAFFTLYQLGVASSKNVFTIMDAEIPWSAFSDDVNIVSAVKQYIYLKVRNVFDPPTSSYVLSAYESQIQELEWRLREMAAGMFNEEDDDDDCKCPDSDTDPDNPGGDGGGDEDLNPPVEPSYKLPIASSDRLGGVMIGENIHAAADGTISVDDPILSEDDLVTKDDIRFMIDRVFKDGEAVFHSVDSEADSAEPDADGSDEIETPSNPDEGYVLPIASADQLGGVKIGKNVHINEIGVISVDSVVVDEEDLASADEVKEMLNNVFGKE